MTDKTSCFLDYLKSGEHKKLRKHVQSFGECPLIAEKQLESFKSALEICPPVLLGEYDDFGFNRGCDFSMLWGSGNVTPNYFRIISKGFDAIKSQIKASMAKTHNIGRKKYGRIMLSFIDLCLEYSDRFREEIKDKNDRLYKALLKVPHNPAESFYEACVFIKLCVFFLRLSYTDHVGLGRFDQYMYSFYLSDKNSGVSDEELLETLENFFISLNFDTDLYWGMQQGDNGQSMVLGGFDQNGKYLYNELSDMCMKASLELCIIDPKINLRVGKNTPEEVFEFATQLTKQGLGFPQYCNDDVVIPGLIKLGYDKSDAYNYVVAACWEFIIPNCGADTPNYHMLDFPSVIGDMIRKELCGCGTFDELMEKAKLAVACECERLLELGKTVVRVENPLLSVFMDGCIESLIDTWFGGTKYRNMGSHGVGIANAADALSAIKKNVFDNKTVTAKQLIEALDADFEGFEEIRNLLLASPKMGNNDDYVDSIASELMNSFSESFNNKPNIFGGIWRAGTGSAQNYIYAAEKCPATADGRKAGQPFPSSFSPSLEARTPGVLSVIQSFTKHDLSDIINGGPLTIEIHDSVLRNQVGVKKTAQLVKAFIDMGGHQLQLNSVNREKLLDAQKHPENYPNLIVRVWGWSGYFNELDPEFQNHIIKRCEYMV